MSRLGRGLPGRRSSESYFVPKLKTLCAKIIADNFLGDSLFAS